MTDREYKTYLGIRKCYVTIWECETLKELHEKTKIPYSSIREYLTCKKTLELLGQERYDVLQEKIKQMHINAYKNRNAGVKR